VDAVGTGCQRWETQRTSSTSGRSTSTSTRTLAIAAGLQLGLTSAFAFPLRLCGEVSPWLYCWRETNAQRDGISNS
jgi:hypothetical protein